MITSHSKQAVKMPDSFFQSDKKRKRTRPGSWSGTTRRPQLHKAPIKPSFKPRDEDLSSESGGEPIDLGTIDFREGRGEAPREDEDYVDENETAAEKRVRLAKGYLARVRDEVEAGKWEIIRYGSDGVDQSSGERWRL